jgi:hypothetical protein
MRTIIAGSRAFDKLSDEQGVELVNQAVLEAGFDITVVLNGCARGIDTFGKLWGLRNGKMISYYPADWKKYGLQAGYLRNIEMSNHAQALVCIWDGKSKGALHVQTEMRKRGKQVYVMTIEE